MPKTIAMPSLERIFSSPLFRTVILPAVILFYVLRPLLGYLFPATAAATPADSPPAGAGTKKAQDKGGISANASDTSPRSCAAFLKAHQHRAKGIPAQQYPQQLPPAPLSVAARTAKTTKTGDADNDNGIGAAMSANQLRARLQLTADNVVTVATTAAYVRGCVSLGDDGEYIDAGAGAGSDMSAPTAAADDVHALVRELSSLANVHVFLLVRLEAGSKDSAEAVQEESAAVRRGLVRLTDGPHAVLPPARVLLSTTNTGRTAAVRQLRSTIHVDFDHNICRNMETHVRSIIYVSLPSVNVVSAGAAGTGAHVTTSVTTKEAAAEAVLSTLPGARGISSSSSSGSGSGMSFSGEGLILIRSYRQLCSLRL